MKINVIDQWGHDNDISVKVFTFSGGEVHVKIDMEAFKYSFIDLTTIQKVEVHQDIRSSDDFMAVVMVKDALDEILRFNPKPIELFSLYVPYARQDRYCEKGEAFGVKSFARLLNILEFSRVLVADPHSEVTPAVITNLDAISQDEIAFHVLKWKLRMENFELVSPDGGALKKIFKLAKRMELPVHCADKIRDTATGDIIRTDISVQDFHGANLMIVDDICDNGGTFLALGKLLKERNAGRVELYVTHGIFGKGIDIFDGIIDSIHCFNAWGNNIHGRNTKGILVENQEMLQKLIVK
uniref:Ribose-phosphate pyrophosphokinase n=1 Tax=Klebsiella phage FKP3 TaxID=3231233 RepID=A0AAU8HZM0_9CAUD